MRSESLDSVDSQPSIGQTVGHQWVQSFLQQMSGQQKQFNVIECDHSYAKPWNRHPDGQIRAKAAKFLFMKNFPKHFLKKQSILELENSIDVETVETKTTLSLFNNSGSCDQSLKTSLNENDINSNELPTPPKTGWTTQMNKLWTKAMKILHSDRLARLSYESLINETILKRNLSERSANKFRHLFASAGWDLNLLSWLNNTLNEYVGPLFISPYHESMTILRAKIPSLIDKFYVQPKCETSRFKRDNCDPIQNMLNNYKAKRINGSPLFLIVPNGPQIPHQMTSQRMKHWHNLFGSLGKVITISAISRPYESTSDFMNEIRFSVRDKIKECKSTFNEGRPLVLVGFGHSSLVAAHCALDNAHNVNATICLGFPLTAINGFRGDLDDPLLETTVSTLFVIGQNSTMATLDDMEDFRERITKTETGLVVVGGANDRLVVSSSKKKFDGITQAMVDRCIADEIFEFVSSVLNPSSTNFDHSLNFNTHSPTKSNKNLSFGISTPKQRKKRTTKDKERGKGRPRKKPKLEEQITADAANSVTSTPTASQRPSAITPESSLKSPAFSSIKAFETNSNPIRNDMTSAAIEPLVHSTPERVGKSKSEDTPHNEANTPSTTSTETNTTPVHTPKTERHYGLSYGISELPTVISQSATRTGRQIRAPKSLDV